MRNSRADMRDRGVAGRQRRASSSASGGGPAGHGRRLLASTLGVLVAIPLFCALGFWQLDRAAEKRALQAEYDRRAQRPPVTLTAEVRPTERLQFSRVQARGTYDTEYQLLWDNRIHHGVPGYHVLTPLHIAGGDTRVLVNRGWVPADPDRDRLPVTDPPAGTVTVRGVAAVPHVGFMLGELDTLGRARPTVWQQIDLARYAARVEWPVQPVVILLDSESPGGYVREWTRLDTGVAVHHGYAFQWFMLAATALGAYLLWLYRLYRPRGGGGGR